MLDIDESDEAFFDSVEHLSSFQGNELVCEEFHRRSNSEYEIWASEPLSVRERRENFLHGMGFVDLDSKHEVTRGNSSQISGSKRMTECSGAVMSSFPSPSCDGAEGSSACGRERDGKTNGIVVESGHDHWNKTNMSSEEDSTWNISSYCPKMQSCQKDFWDLYWCSRKARSWWKGFMKGRPASISRIPKVNRMQVKQKNKRCKEFTGMFVEQEIQGHEGYIWKMMFSPDSQYLASGGEDGVVRIWKVASTDASCKSSTLEHWNKVGEGNSFFQRKKSWHPSIVIPEKVFQINEFPLQEFYGHTSDVIDLAWSNSNCLLSCSKDKTVRLWKVGCEECLCVFHHSNCVSCIQFNPLDENSFISGSIDGKVRIWGIPTRRVMDWVGVRDVVTALCYQPDGKGFVVGLITGACHFYDASGSNLRLDAQIHMGKRKTSGNAITGIQFSLQQPQKVMISSEDSKVRIFNGIDIVQKYKAPRKSGSQKSASFTSTGKHIVSVGEDSRIYVWNHHGSSKHSKSIRSCEHFSSEGVSVAIPWSGMGMGCTYSPLEHDSGTSSDQCTSQLHNLPESAAASLTREADRFSLGSWFSTESQSRRSATWPEEKLSGWGSPAAQLGHLHLHHTSSCRQLEVLPSWGLVIVAASWDGTIKTFHNYGLPLKLRGKS